MRLRKSFEDTYMAEKKVVLHFRRSETSLEGYLVRQTANSYFLAKAKILDAKAEFDLQGTTVVPKDDVFFIQVLETTHAL